MKDLHHFHKLISQISEKKWKPRIFTFCLALILSVISTNIYAQNSNISIDLKGVTVVELIRELEESTNYGFFFRSEDLDKEKKHNYSFKDVSIETILDEILKDENASYNIKNGVVIILKKNSETTSTTQRIVTGKITDDSGLPVPGTTISIKGENIGSICNVNGDYNISVTDGNSILIFSFIGMKTQEILVGEKSVIDVNMKPEAIGLNEVVVVGYGTQIKANLTGAVDKISASDIENKLASNTSQTLQGLVPNMNVSFGDGGINTNASINIRGLSSINGGSPLILIDGVAGELNSINPKDIESISVLKDAASASIYGARGAFGVILITTKKANKDKINISYSGYTGLSSPTIHTENFITDGLEWMELSDKLSLLENSNTYLGYSQEDKDYLMARRDDPSLPSVLIKNINGLERYVHYGNTDWWDYIFNDAQSSQEHNLNISGGSDKMSYYISGRYYNREGIYKINPDVLNSYTLRAKIDIEVTERFSIENNTNFYSSKYTYPATNARIIDGSSNHEDWRKYTFHASPLNVPVNPDGSIMIVNPNSPTRDIADGTFADLIYGKSKGQDNNYDLTNKTAISYKISKGINIKADYSFRKESPFTWLRLISTPHTNQPGGNGVTYYKTNKQTYKEYYRDRLYQAFNAYIDYNYDLFDGHKLSGVLGYNQEWRSWKRTIIYQDGSLSENLNSFNLTTGENMDIESDANAWAIRAGFYRLKYNIKDKYLFETNGRLDASSKFPEGNRSVFFPSISAAWRISQEEFFSPVKKHINNLKLRGSYGSLGNQDVGEYDYISRMSVNTSSYISGGSQLSYLSTPNTVSSNFTWETASTFDIGADIGAFNNRLNISYDWFQRDVTNMLTQGKQLPSVYGATEPDENAADMRTRGFELSIGWSDKFNIAGKALKFNILGSLADSRSTITKFDNPNGDIEQYYVGMEIGEIWGYEVEGFFETDDEYLSHADQILVNKRIHNNYLINHPVAGDIKFRDIGGNDDGSPDRIISAGNRTLDDHGDLKIIGNSSPRYSYGMNFNCSYEGFTLDMFWQGIAKKDWWPGKDNSYFWGPFGRQYQNFYPESIESMSWTPDNPDAYFPRLAVYSVQEQGLEGSQLGVPSDKYLQNAGYLRLKNVTLSYSFPKKWMETTKMAGARIYLTASNLLTLSPLYKNNPDKTTDPEQLGDGNAYPFSKTIALGVNLDF